MPKNIIAVFVIIVFIVSFGTGYTFGKRNVQTNSNTEHAMDMADTKKVEEVHEIADMAHMMEDMSAGLVGKTGDDFDKAFLDEMIIHHKGAVDMANLAIKNAGHKEIVDLSRAIIRAQNKEITDMQNWKKVWFNNK